MLRFSYKKITCFYSEDGDLLSLFLSISNTIEKRSVFDKGLRVTPLPDGNR